MYLYSFFCVDTMNTLCSYFFIKECPGPSLTIFNAVWNIKKVHTKFVEYVLHTKFVKTSICERSYRIFFTDFVISQLSLFYSYEPPITSFINDEDTPLPPWRYNSLILKFKYFAQVRNAALCPRFSICPSFITLFGDNVENLDRDKELSPPLENYKCQQIKNSSSSLSPILKTHQTEVRFCSRQQYRLVEHKSVNIRENVSINKCSLKKK